MIVFITATTAALHFNEKTDAAFASLKTDEAKVVMVVADYLSIEDINKMNYLRKLAGDSFVALINNRQSGKASASKSKLTIGSGKRLEINANMVIGGSDKSHRMLYRIESGKVPEPESLVFVDIYKLRNKNTHSEYQKYIGYLGDVVNKNNGITCLLGNADAAEQNRSAILIAMDSNGLVDIGETENVFIDDELFPYGKRTDFKRLAELYKQYLPASSFTVIETGDMERLEQFRASMSNEAYESYRSNVLKSIDSFIEELVSVGGFKTLVFISTYPSKTDSEANNRLTPIVVYEKGKRGVLYSGNTRREGIILNTDLADYILKKLGYENSSDIAELEKDKAVHFLEAMNKNIVRTSVLRTPVLTFYAVMVITALGILFVIAVFSRKKASHTLIKLRTVIAGFILAFPLALLYMPTSLLGESTVKYIAFVSAVSLILSITLHTVLKNEIKLIFSICLLLLAGLSADILSGSPLIKQSVLGYDPVIGARFYGIGNEYAGMFIGCSLMVFGCIKELRGNMPGKAATVIYFLTCTFLLGLTFLGANLGGALAGASGYLLAYFLVYGIKFSKRNISAGVTIFCTIGAALILLDSFEIFRQSHMGRLIKDYEANGFGVITSTIQRKITMNLRLIRYTIWTKVLLCIIATVSMMFYKPAKQLSGVFKRYKYMGYSWSGIAASAAVGFAVNDSGIVLAATAMIYSAFTMIIMCIGERNEG